jgi:hypothetical protein
MMYEINTKRTSLENQSDCDVAGGEEIDILGYNAVIFTVTAMRTSDIILSFSYHLHNSWHKYTTRFPSLHVSA